MAPHRPDRPKQFPRQVILMTTDEQADRIAADAAARGDRSKSAAARRLIALGTLLADELALGLAHSGDDSADADALADLKARAAAVR